MLQYSSYLSGSGGPHHDGSVRGAADQVVATWAESAAVNPVAVTQQWGEGKLREVSSAVNTNSLITGGGGQENRGEGAAVHLIRVLSESGNYRHHLVTGLSGCGSHTR